MGRYYGVGFLIPSYTADDTIVRKAVKNGEISLKVNREKQLRHTKVGHAKGRSYLNGDLAYAQKLVNELSGTGKPVLDNNGNWMRRERVTAGEIVGVHVDKKHWYRNENE